MSSEVVGYIIGAGGICFGVFSYFTSGVLADKEKIIRLIAKVEELERRMKDNEEDIDEVKEYYNRGRNN